ncbi:MAG: PilZ domain-containing protein [Desulfobacter sp.]|nr:MAG: PilZ domain-containing protein [Desulfobacter sp.]
MTLMDLKNRRNAHRMSFNGMVDLVVEGRLYKEMGENISESGIFIQSSRPEKYTIFDKLTLAFQGPDDKPVKHVGRVVRKGGGGIGVLYLDTNQPVAYQAKPNIQPFFS